ncbi:hypothetical protein IC235_18740 [Hymenobacter sp. BT664]|uniref:Uncharacterized protein n=1 Tax=Hymenobacter montanus TaxID=2771359 RepID=A0A927GKU6_9BACT|nr:hypothetical protein [Hymenobacter montanus]MBD2769932.1 hypothetical protein [Hymenobacter montanus]
MRFRVYFQSVATFIDAINFTHHALPAISAYFLANNANKEPDLMNSVEQMFRELYIVPEAMEPNKPSTLSSGNGG